MVADYWVPVVGAIATKHGFTITFVLYCRWWHIVKCPPLILLIARHSVCNSLQFFQWLVMLQCCGQNSGSSVSQSIASEAVVGYNQTQIHHNKQISSFCCHGNDNSSSPEHWYCPAGKTTQETCNFMDASPCMCHIQCTCMFHVPCMFHAWNMWEIGTFFMHVTCMNHACYMNGIHAMNVPCMIHACMV